VYAIREMRFKEAFVKGLVEKGYASSAEDAATNFYERVIVHLADHLGEDPANLGPKSSPKNDAQKGSSRTRRA
jgi:hypothetical protein